MNCLVRVRVQKEALEAKSALKKHLEALLADVVQVRTQDFRSQKVGHRLQLEWKDTLFKCSICNEMDSGLLWRCNTPRCGDIMHAACLAGKR